MANLSYFSFENMCHRKEYLHRTPLKKIVFRFIYICICLRYKKKNILSAVKDRISANNCMLHQIFENLQTFHL